MKRMSLPLGAAAFLSLLLFAVLFSLRRTGPNPVHARYSAQPLHVSAPIGTAFLYQGKLLENAVPPTRPYTMTFRLYDDSAMTNPPLATFGPISVTVNAGLFHATLDFGITPFDGQALWLEIVVGSTSLAPLQPLRPTPYALNTDRLDGQDAGYFGTKADVDAMATRVFVLESILTADGDGDGSPAYLDCNDNDPFVNPGATEVCNGVDDDCDGVVDNGFTQLAYYYDSDGDGHGTVNRPLLTCETSPPSGYVTSAGDCHDGESQAFPGQTSYFSNPRPDGSFDYDCNSFETEQYSTLGSCTMTTSPAACEYLAGWETGAPACGVTGNFVSSCDLGCSPVIASRTQACR